MSLKHLIISAATMYGLGLFVSLNLGWPVDLIRGTPQARIFFILLTMVTLGFAAVLASDSGSGEDNG